VLDSKLLAKLEEVPASDDPVAERRRQAEQLVAAAGDQRQALEAVQAGFLRRLHQASDDFKATEGLRVVDLALSLMPRPEGPWSYPQ
jgi:hypothetical protein